MFTDVKRNLLLIKRRQSLTPREHCMRTTTVGGVDRQKWTAMEIKKPAYTNVEYSLGFCCLCSCTIYQCPG